MSRTSQLPSCPINIQGGFHYPVYFVAGIDNGVYRTIKLPLFEHGAEITGAAGEEGPRFVDTSRLSRGRGDSGGLKEFLCGKGAEYSLRIE